MLQLALPFATTLRPPDESGVLPIVGLCMPKTKILAIDDDGLHLQLLQIHLEDRGFDVLLATDGHHGIKLASDEIPDLILCDVIMPGLDGFRVLAALKSSPATADIPVILITGSPRGEDAGRAAEAGAEAYLAKLGQFDAIVSLIEERLAGAEALRHMRAALPPPAGAPLQEA